MMVVGGTPCRCPMAAILAAYQKQEYEGDRKGLPR
jgi:hypothetical protein